MAVPANRHSGPYLDGYEGTGYRESKFSRTAWEKIESRIQDQAPVTMWIGIASVVVAVTIADLDPDDLTISVLGVSLMIRGTAKSNFFSQDIYLPCTVDVNPIRISNGRGILYILLSKNKETGMLTAGEHSDKHPTIPLENGR